MQRISTNDGTQNGLGEAGGIECPPAIDERRMYYEKVNKEAKPCERDHRGILYLQLFLLLYLQLHGQFNGQRLFEQSVLAVCILLQQCQLEQSK